MPRQPKKSGGKTETIAVRVTPKQKYKLELQSRRYRRSISEVVSSSIDEMEINIDAKEFVESMGLDKLTEKNVSSNTSINEAMERISDLFAEGNEMDIFEALWDAEEPTRVVKLGMHFPSLLEYPIEEIAWKIIQENDAYWWGRRRKIPDYQKIREDWDKIKKQAEERAK